VRLDSFGFQRAMEELGVQRRLLTAGDHKGILDPFSPLSEWDKDFLQGLLDNCISSSSPPSKRAAAIGSRAVTNSSAVLFWTGEQSVELGLSDGIGSSSYVAREVIVGAEEIVKYSKKAGPVRARGRRVCMTLAGDGDVVQGPSPSKSGRAAAKFCDRGVAWKMPIRRRSRPIRRFVPSTSFHLILHAELAK
jgi:ClpP class serine protease